jgi:pyridoxine 4-dehydrogenase
MSPSSEPLPAPGGTYQLGGFQVARIGYGAMQLERYHANPSEGVELLARAFELGVNHVDTAQFYGGGFVNSLLRKALKPQNSIVIATKIGAEPNPGGPIPLRPAQRPEQLRASVEENLTSLGLEQIPLVYLRRLDVAPGIVAEGDQLVDIDDQLATLISLRDAGKVGAIGLSGIDLDKLRRAVPSNIVAVQNEYSLVARQFEEMLKFCLSKNIAWVPFFPLGGAFPGRPKVTDLPKVIEISKQLNVTPSQVGLSWLLEHAVNTLLIPGTASGAHLGENVWAGAIALDPAATAELETVSVSPIS